jgi:hypothetical protein
MHRQRRLARYGHQGAPVGSDWWPPASACSRQKLFRSATASSSRLKKRFNSSGLPNRADCPLRRMPCSTQESTARSPRIVRRSRPDTGRNMGKCGAKGGGFRVAFLVGWPAHALIAQQAYAGPGSGDRRGEHLCAIGSAPAGVGRNRHSGPWYRVNTVRNWGDWR